MSRHPAARFWGVGGGSKVAAVSPTAFSVPQVSVTLFSLPYTGFPSLAATGRTVVERDEPAEVILMQ